MTPLEDDRRARALLGGCPSIGPVRFRFLKEAFGSASEAVAAGPGEWQAVEGFGPPLSEVLSREFSAAREREEEEARIREKAGVRCVIPRDDEYPENLKSLDDRPFILYMKGDRRPLDSLAVGIVGSRLPTVYGRAAAERLARELAEAGVTVVSGLARGIDSVAHEAVVLRGGRTIGIMGSGFGRFYPPENQDLADKMVEHGAVVTEYSWFTKPLPIHFPRRNRLISGMSLGIVVVEAGIQSGALITARLAAEQGREVFAVPGPIFSDVSRGPNRLLKEGARPVEDAQDILDALEVFRPLMAREPLPAKLPRPRPDLPAPEAAVLDKITLDPAGLDALGTATGMAPGALSSVLLHLELKGLVRSLPGKSFVRSEAALKG